MSLRKLQLEAFRNIPQLKLAPSTGVNVLLGDNGAGKTSVLESIAVVGRGRSFRCKRVAECIQKENKFFRILMEIESSQKPAADLFGNDMQSSAPKIHKLGYERQRSQWMARLNGEDVKQLSELAHLLPITIFEPTTQELISGAPEVRRRYLDWGLFHVEPQFLQLWREHDRILKQRNAALKNNSPDRMIQILDQVYVPLALKLHELRRQHVEQLREEWKTIVPELAPALVDLDIDIKAGWKAELSLEESLHKGLAYDRQMGTTRSGAHRDDLKLLLKGSKAQAMLSRGQQKISALMLILAQLNLWRDRLDQSPILLLDDLTSELDEAHAQRTLEWLLSTKLQTWISSVAWPEPFTEAVKRESGQMFHVEQGQVSSML
ncbi:MAG: DNA replication/repair protein RecF [Xanthomonadales bacterium]|jgi:DNA replication and repair protein RecF|nr:DNA replication/repair protein RecF [Xanthomonadales bacterium]